MRSARTRPVVLVVDDDATLRETVGLMLEEEFEVLDAPNGVTGIEVALRAPVDAVLLDILMPGPDGIQTLRQLRDARPDLPVVILSAHDSATTAVTAMRLGAADYLTKPCDLGTLLATIRRAIHPAGQFTLQARDGPPFLLALIGGDAGTAATLSATLAGELDVRTYPEPPAAESLAALGRVAIIIVETKQARVDWLARTASLVDRFRATPVLVLLDPRQSVEARFAFGDWCRALERPFHFSALLDLVSAALPRSPVRQPWRDPRLAAVIEAILADYAGFRLRALATRLGVSPWHLSRRFHKGAGLALSGYVTLVRFHAARYLLQHTGDKLETIATSVGFHDASHLSRVFVSLTGRRPGEHRNGAITTR